MNTRLHCLASLAFTSALLAGTALSSADAFAGVRVCTFPGSPSAPLDRAVAREAFKAAHIEATVLEGAFGASDDDGVSLKELNAALARHCDVIAGFPRSAAAGASDSKLKFSRGYLRSGYVSVTTDAAAASANTANVIAATYASPGQLIAVQQKGARLVLENTSESTVDAVVAGHAGRAIVWYPALVAYRLAHPQQRLAVAGTSSPYADWHLVFAFGAKSAALQPRVDAALAAMSADGRLAAMTQQWALPKTAVAATSVGELATSHTQADAFAYRDGPAPTHGPNAYGAALLSAGLSSSAQGGSFIKVDASTASAPSFVSAQVAHGKKLYAGACAKCHGANLEGLNAPALKGPAFAPASGSHLTIGGVFTYMFTNMPADNPGKLKPQDYADLMAYLLNSNGYAAGATKLTADAAKASATPLNAGSAVTVGASQ